METDFLFIQILLPLLSLSFINFVSRLSIFLFAHFLTIFRMDYGIGLTRDTFIDVTFYLKDIKKFSSGNTIIPLYSKSKHVSQKINCQSRNRY